MMKRSPWQKADYSDIQKLQILLKYLPSKITPKGSPSTIIAAEEEGGIIVMGGEILAKYAENFLNDAYDYGWVQDFDWNAWQQSDHGKALLENHTALASATTEDLAKIITIILRIEKMAGGKLAASFDSGLIGHIAQRAERLLEFAVMESNSRPWPREYYDVIHHYLYAPDRLEHRSLPDDSEGRQQRVEERLSRIEEPLNHIMGFFFALAPSSFVQQLFADYCGLASVGPLRLLGRSIESDFQLGNFMQPDFVFDGADSFWTIEAKIESKSSMDQLVKYAVIHCMAASKTPGRFHALLFLAKKPQARLFKENAHGWEETRRLAKLHLQSNPPKNLAKLNVDINSVATMIDNLKLGYMNYSNLADALERQSRTMQASSNDEGVRLYRGLLFELKRRLLC